MLKFEYQPLLRRIKMKSLGKVAVKDEGTVDLRMVRAKVRMELWSEIFKKPFVPKTKENLMSKGAADELRKQNEQKLIERSREETFKLMAKIENFYELPSKIEPIEAMKDQIVDENFKRLINLFARNIESLSSGKGKYEKIVFPEFIGCKDDVM